MEISLLLMQQIAQLFLILIMGYAVVKVGLLKASDSRVLSVVMVYLVTPCVIINAFQIDDTPEIRKGLLYSMAIAAVIHVVLLVLSALLSRPLKLDAVEQVNVTYSNAAALVIPLVKALMGDAYVIYSCAFIIVQLVLLWTHASSLLQGSSALDWKKVLTNINMIAIAAGALLYWFRVVLPAPLQNTMSTVGNMMGPMGMLLAGMAIAEKPLREVFCTRRNYLPTVLRLVVCPLVVLVLLWVCHASSWVADGKNILMTVYLAAITPACATVTSMAQLYDRDAAHSSALYVLTTLLSIVSIPVITGYTLDGVQVPSFDPLSDLDRVEPVVTMLPGWNKDISGCKSWDELPKEAKAYVEFLEKQLGHEIQFVSTGAEREKFVLKGEWL